MAWFFMQRQNWTDEAKSLTGKINFWAEDAVQLQNEDPEGYFFLAENHSLLYSKGFGDYSILLGGNWRYELRVDSETGLCVNFQCFLQNLRVAHTALKLPPSQRKNLYVTGDIPLCPGCGCRYTPYQDIALWDRRQRILCVGEPTSTGEAIEFADKTIAMIEGGKLMCVYLILDSISETAIDGF